MRPFYKKPWLIGASVGLVTGGLIGGALSFLSFQQYQHLSIPDILVMPGQFLTLVLGLAFCWDTSKGLCGIFIETHVFPFLVFSILYTMIGALFGFLLGEIIEKLKFK